MSGTRGGYGVTISAYDQASKQIDVINKRLAALSAPTERFGKSVAKLADTTGVRAMASGMRDMASHALSAFQNIGRIVPALGAITGAASVAGLARMTAEWADYGTQIQNAALRAGTTAGRFSALQGAARLAGSSAEAMSSGMRSLKDNIFEIAAGRAAPLTIAAFNTLGVATRDATGHLRSADQVLPELADKIAAIQDPTQQATLATLTLGGAGEELLPFLRKGAAGIAEYTQKARDYGAISDTGAEAANRLREKQTELTLSVEGLRNALAEQLEPVLGPMLHDLAEWIKANRNIIASDVAGWVKTTVPQVMEFARNVNDVVKSFGGWETVIKGIIEISLVSWVAGVVTSLSPLTLALAGIALTIEKISAFNKQGLDKLPKDSPLWTNVPEEEQSNYVNSPRSQRFLNPTNQNTHDFHWYNPGSWLNNPDAPWYLGGGQPRVGAGAGSARLPRGIRNNNPLNLEYRPDQAGVTGHDSRFGIYGSMAAGVAAGVRQLVINQDKHGIHTIAGQVARWAPNNENDTRAYIADVATRLHRDPNADINVKDPIVARQLVAAMAHRETGRDLNDRDVVEGVHMALGGQAPPMAIAGGTGSNVANTPQTQTVRGSADLKISLNNFPPGTRTQAKADGMFNTPVVENAMQYGLP